MAADGLTLGAIAVADRPRETARETIELLREQHVVSVAMLTGDHEETAAAIARGAEDRRVSRRRCFRSTSRRWSNRCARADGALMMVGDGVNDAPALAAADVGVAMGRRGIRRGARDR